MPFDDLGEDILLSTLCFCDVYTVLAVSGINKVLRRIALSKQLWLSLVQDSKFCNALELPPLDRDKLQGHSTQKLIDFVKSHRIGPNFRQTSDMKSFATMTSFKIHLDDLGDRPEVRILPGARYILFHSVRQKRYSIYDIWNARRVWQHSIQGYTLCQVDLVPNGAIARVFLVQPSGFPHFPHRHAAHVEEVDLTTGTSHEVFSVTLSTTRFGMPCAIVGDFLLCGMHHSLFNAAKLFLINWRESTFIFLRQVSSYTTVKLIPGHIVSTYRENSPLRQQILAVTALDAFSNHWHPLTEDNIAAQLARQAPPITPTLEERLEYSNRPLGTDRVAMHLTVTLNALYAGAYNVDVYGGQLSEPEAPGPTLMARISNFITARRRKAAPVALQARLSYRFTPAVFPGEACSLRLKSSQPNVMQRFRARATITWLGSSIIVLYR
ncbi:hypothetical protein C8R45DRAFT_1014836 [Mycena sanguinolenta]|nr:hypothetical protein C8R45DRAFT_1014836 [Mycena sanguinolenta]